MVNATVLGGLSPATNIQWLRLGTFDTVNPVNASSIILTTWTYSRYVSVFPIPLVVSADD